MNDPDNALDGVANDLHASFRRVEREGLTTSATIGVRVGLFLLVVLGARWVLDRARRLMKRNEL